MSEADPSWFAPAMAIGTSFGAMVVAIWQGRKPRAPATQHSEASVVTATFMDRQAVSDLTSATRNIHGALNVLNEHMTEMNGHMRETSQRAHDQQVREDAVLRARLGKGE